MKTIRFLPLVALAAFSLLGLKLAGMMFGENIVPVGTAPSLARQEASSPQRGQKTKSVKGTKGANNSLAAKRIGAPKTVVPRDVTSLQGDTYRTKSEVLLLASLLEILRARSFFRQSRLQSLALDSFL